MSATPTLEDAQRVARVLADDHNLASVLLFGSVAKSQAVPGSDLDLIAIYDDLDYATRYSKRQVLEGTIRSCVDYDIDLKVTDLPEWRLRSQTVRNSFEYGIAPTTKVLFAVQPSQVNWGKEINLPDTEQKETRSHLDSMANEIALAARMFMLTDDEEEAKQYGDLELLNDERRQRLAQVCAHCALTLEHGLKALRSMVPFPLMYSHSGPRLAEGLPERMRPRCSVIGQPLLEDIEDWRQAGTYASKLDDMEMTNQELYDESMQYIQAASDFADQVLEEYEATYNDKDRAYKKLKRKSDNLRFASETINLWDGVPVRKQAKRSVHDQTAHFSVGTFEVSPTKLGNDIKCSHVGVRNRKKCVLKLGHRGDHRYS